MLPQQQLFLVGALCHSFDTHLELQVPVKLGSMQLRPTESVKAVISRIYGILRIAACDGKFPR